jgi:radical SAM protein with 4Fe4S-binding SPASM domain
VDERARNLSAIEREIDAGRTEVATTPVDLIFSAEHRCNLRCVQCPSTVERRQGGLPLMDRRLPETTLERFLKLEAILPRLRFTSLTGSGEPMLSPALGGLLERLAHHQVPATTFNTHGNLLDRARCELIVDQRLANLTVSVDAATRETYERIRVGGKWERLLAGLETLNAVKRERGSERPTLVLAGNFMRQNIEELPGLVELAARFSASVLATNTVLYDPAMRDQALIYHRALTREMTVRAIRRARELGVGFDNRLYEPGEGEPPLEGEAPPANVAPPPEPPSPQPLPPRRSAILKACQAPWTGLMVESDGQCKVCCFESPYVGNLNDQSFAEIWNSPGVQELRRQFLDDDPPLGCRRCFIFMQSQAREEQFVRGGR